MAQPARLSTAELVRRAAQKAMDAADAMEITSRTMARVEGLIGEVEQAAQDLRTAVRGAGAR
jgi:hypothetical protein